MGMRIKNVSAAQKLAARYKELTFPIVRSYWHEWHTNYPQGALVAFQLLGFGSMRHCPLCKSAGNCESCLYKHGKKRQGYCSVGRYRDSFSAVCRADTPIKLLEALRVRQAELQELIPSAINHNKPYERGTT